MQPVGLNAAPRGTTTGPDTPAPPLWMCEAVGLPMPENVDFQQTWPPLILDPATAAPVTGDGVQGPLSVVVRSDGARQVADNGRPLYRYSGDTKAGDTNGDGIGSVWHVVTLGAASSPRATSSSGY